MILGTSTLGILGNPILGIFACSSPDVRVVEANPELMYELGSRRGSGEVVTLEGEKPKPRKPGKMATNDGGDLRLPNMESLPTNRELEDRKPNSANPGGVISRPPAD